MLFTTVGTLFLIVFGAEIGYTAVFGNGDGDDGDWLDAEPLVGHPIRFNLSGHIIPVTEMNEYSEGGIEEARHDDLPVPHELASNRTKRRAIVFMAFINVGECVCDMQCGFGSCSVHFRRFCRRRLHRPRLADRLASAADPARRDQHRGAHERRRAAATRRPGRPAVRQSVRLWGQCEFAAFLGAAPRSNRVAACAVAFGAPAGRQRTDVADGKRGGGQRSCVMSGAEHIRAHSTVVFAFTRWTM